MSRSSILLEAAGGQESNGVFRSRVREDMLVELDRLGVEASEDGSEVVIRRLDRGIEVDNVEGSRGPLNGLSRKGWMYKLGLV